jgi:hypothetical protein
MSALERTLFIAEPPAQYLVLPPIVVDCSTLAGLVFEGTGSSRRWSGFRVKPCTRLTSCKLK